MYYIYSISLCYLKYWGLFKAFVNIRVCVGSDILVCSGME